MLRKFQFNFFSEVSNMNGNQCSYIFSTSYDFILDQEKEVFSAVSKMILSDNRVETALLSASE